MHSGVFGTRGLKYLSIVLMLALLGCNPEKQWQGLEITAYLPALRSA